MTNKEKQKKSLLRALQALERIHDVAGSRRMAWYWIENCLALMDEEEKDLEKEDV